MYSFSFKTFNYFNGDRLKNSIEQLKGKILESITPEEFHLVEKIHQDLYKKSFHITKKTYRNLMNRSERIK